MLAPGDTVMIDALASHEYVARDHPNRILLRRWRVVGNRTLLVDGASYRPARFADDSFRRNLNRLQPLVVPKFTHEGYVPSASSASSATNATRAAF